MRMKTYMASHVDEHRQTMFHESTEEVKKHLTHMCRQVEEQMSNKADEVFELMRRDYMTAITGAHMPEGRVTPKWERTLKADIAKVLSEMENAAAAKESGMEPKPELGDEEAVEHNPSLTEVSNKAGEKSFVESDSPVSRDDAENLIQATLNEEIKQEYS
jgi:hypothetical protein